MPHVGWECDRPEQDRHFQHMGQMPRTSEGKRFMDPCLEACLDAGNGHAHQLGLYGSFTAVEELPTMSQDQKQRPIFCTYKYTHQCQHLAKSKETRDPFLAWHPCDVIFYAL